MLLLLLFTVTKIVTGDFDISLEIVLIPVMGKGTPLNAKAHHLMTFTFFHVDILVRNTRLFRRDNRGFLSIKCWVYNVAFFS